MKLALCLFKYFPYGGLQRDCIRIARACVARGHTVTILTSRWDGPRPDGLPVEILPVKGTSNHARNRSFVAARDAYLARHVHDGVIGFDKMPGLDAYYAADTCFAEKAATQRPWLYRFTPRYKTAIEFESAVFGPASHTQMLSISDAEAATYSRHYGTPAARIHPLPPGIARDRTASAVTPEERARIRREFSIGDEDVMLLSVGSDFTRKGVGRTLEAMACLPAPLLDRLHFVVVGQDKAKPFEAQARKLGVEKHVHFLSGRDDVPALLAAANVFTHPAYSENTGTVILEALVAGLPIIVTDVCGYAHYIPKAQCGVVLDSPFATEHYTRELASMLADASLRQQYSRNALAYAAREDLYSMPETAAEIIERTITERKLRLS